MIHNRLINRSMKLLNYIFLIAMLYSCTPKMNFYSGAANFKSEDGKPDYSKLEYWAAHPEKWDPSDTVPAPLKERIISRDADVFWVHPTTFTGQRGRDETNASIDDSVINYKTDYSSIIYQASVFNERGRIFAPRYRQAHITMYLEKDSVTKAASFEKAYQDVKAAFLYYLNHENEGRPIIIASHSQGTTHTTRLLKELFDGKPLSKQLVCAYLVGMVVKKDEFKNIPVCTDISKTGCMVSWRTFRNNYSDDWASRIDTSVVVVNPMSWGSGDEVVGKELHKGAILYNLKKVYRNTQSAQKEGNALWISHPKFPGSFLYRRKNYHAGDINLFYVDIRDDVSRRVDSFLKKNNQDQLIN